MRRGLWYPWIVIGAVMEWLALRNTNHEATLSRFTRWLFRTENSKTGKAVFTAAWVWFGIHVLQGKDGS